MKWPPRWCRPPRRLLFFFFFGVEGGRGSERTCSACRMQLLWSPDMRARLGKKNVPLMTVDGWGNDRWLLPLLIVMMVSPKEYRVPVPPPPPSPLLLCAFSNRLPVSSTHFFHSLHFLQPPPLSPSPTLPYPSNPACNPPPHPNFTSIAAFCHLHLSKHDVATFSTLKKK